MSKENKDRFYYNRDFLGSPDGRPIRLLSEYFGPFQRFKRNNIQDTIVFFGSARLKSNEEAKSALSSAPKNISKKNMPEILVSRTSNTVSLVHYQL